MKDILTQIYYLVDEYLPVVQYPDDAQRALEATLTPVQAPRVAADHMDAFRRDNAERQILFAYLVRLGLHIP